MQPIDVCQNHFYSKILTPFFHWLKRSYDHKKNKNRQGFPQFAAKLNYATQNRKQLEYSNKRPII